MTPTRVLSSVAVPMLSLALVLGPRPAVASDTTWAQTLDTPTVAAHVAAHGSDVLIVTAGRSSNALREVARALRVELEETGTVGLVSVSESSKKNAGLDDASLLGTLDTDAQRVAIVRVDDDRATVSVYDNGGTAVGGFSAARGDTIEPPPETSHSGESALAILEGDLPESEDSALAEYDRKRVVFDGSLQVTATGTNSAVLSRSFEPRTGAGAPLPGDEYYTYVGRDDLAQEYRRRKAGRQVLITAGSLTALTGLVVMLALPLAAVAKDDGCISLEDPIESDACTANADRQQKKKVRRGLGLGGGLLAGGIVMGVIGGKIRPHTSTATDVQEMGESYNKDLRKRLGVREVAVRGSADRRGAGVVLSGRF
ncbi:MAG: hypothetical protein ACRBN8_25520 [Nannocystales bacterium]